MSKKTFIFLSGAAAFCVIIGLVFKIVFHVPSKDISDSGQNISPLEISAVDSNGISIYFRAEGSYFYRPDNNGTWKAVYLKGVNIGLTEATTDVNNPDVSYDTYREWFVLIEEMHANTIRVFTVMPPQFYKALYDHNASAQNTLYLIHGIWFNENYMYDGSAFSDNEKVLSSFRRAVLETVDIVHGNSDYTDYGEIKNAVYSYDISSYLVGYILGLEWDPGFVVRTNADVSRSGYYGEYLKTKEKASAFESFLCEIGDSLIAYETEAYNTQVPVSFLNWATTDTLTHSNEPFDEEDMVSVNTENIIPSETYYCGLFAAVDVYPYYPEFMNYQPEYIEPDENGKINPYRAYLSQLRTQYSVPVLVAEFGVPSSRGMAHKSVMGLNQGGLTEEKQGEAIVLMMQSIAAENYAGAMIFSWQDEWFKQTWNIFGYSSDPLVRTPNVQSAEQCYGLLAMEPGESSVCHVDGFIDDWKNVPPVIEQDSFSLSAVWDEGYLYIKIEMKDERFDFYNDAIIVPISITGRGSDFSSEHDISFSEPVDFLFIINGENQSRLLADAYYDLFYYMYIYEREIFEKNSDFEQPGQGLYVPVKQFISNEIVLPLTGEIIEPQYIESGLLTYGITDPNSPDYNSLSDFYYRDSVIELRVPWYLLNVMNSTSGLCLNDFYKDGGIDVEKISDIYIGLGMLGDDEISLKNIGYYTKEHSSFHTRLKKSYYIVQEAMENFMIFE